MLRRFIVLTSLAAGTAIAVTAAVAAPALAKGAARASITGPGLARPVTVSPQGGGEALPGQGDVLSNLAEQTGLFTVLFGPGNGTPDGPSPLRTPPAAASLGPKYTVTYTVPGVTPEPDQAEGQIRQDLYPRAAGGPVIYTLPGQQGFGQPLQVTGWFRGTPRLTATLARLGIPAGASLPSARSSAASVPPARVRAAAPKPDNRTTPAWLIATIASAVAIAITGTALWLRRRPRPATDQPATEEPSRGGDQRSVRNEKVLIVLDRPSDPLIYPRLSPAITRRVRVFHRVPSPRSTIFTSFRSHPPST